MYNPSTGSINGATINDFFGRMSPLNATLDSSGEEKVSYFQKF